MENRAVKPWDYNPSSWKQRIPIALIGSIALFISIYLGMYQWTLISTVWDPIFGDGTKNVLLSDVSHKITSWIYIPDAILGAVAYLGDVIYALAGSTRRWQYRPWLVIIFGIDVIPLGVVSIILVILQGTVVGYWCFLCLVTAVISLILILFAYDEVWSCLLYLYKTYEFSKSKKVLWDAFIGRPSKFAHEAGLYVGNTRFIKKSRRQNVGKN